MMLSGRFVDALSLAIDVHGDQPRKGTDVTYVSHLLAVAAIVLEFGGDEDQAIAGLLHDTMEDSPDGEVVAATIRERFGPTVEAIVRDCSDTVQLPKPPWLERKRAYIAHLDEKPLATLLVSCADKLHNARATLTDLRTYGAGFWESIGFNAGPADQVWYYRSLSDVFTRRFAGDEHLSVMARELARCVEEIEQIAVGDG